MPPPPEILPDVPTYPAFQPVNRPSVLGQLEVFPPASNKASPRFPQFVTGSALTSPPQLSHLRFESCGAFRRYSDLQFGVQSKAQELSFPTRGAAQGSALSWISCPLPVCLWPTLPVPLLAAFTFSRRCFSIQFCIEASVRSAAA